MSIAEALRRTSQSPDKRGNSPSKPDSINTFDTWTSIVFTDNALDMRTIPLRPRSKRQSFERSVIVDTNRVSPRELQDPEYRQAVARLSLQIRELQSASNDLLNSQSVINIGSSSRASTSRSHTFTKYAARPLSVRKRPKSLPFFRRETSTSKRSANDVEMHAKTIPRRCTIDRGSSWNTRLARFSNLTSESTEVPSRVFPDRLLEPCSEIRRPRSSPKRRSLGRGSDVATSTFGTLLPIKEEHLKQDGSYSGMVDTSKSRRLRRFRTTFNDKPLPNTPELCETQDSSVDVCSHRLAAKVFEGEFEGKRQMAIEEALIPLNELIRQQELQQMRREAIENGIAYNGDKTPCPSTNEFLRFRTARRTKHEENPIEYEYRKIVEGIRESYSEQHTLISEVAKEAQPSKSAATSRRLDSKVSSGGKNVDYEATDANSVSSPQPDHADESDHRAASPLAKLRAELRDVANVSDTSMEIITAIYADICTEDSVLAPPLATDSATTENTINLAEGFARPAVTRAVSSSSTSTSNKRYGMFFQDLSFLPLDLKLLSDDHESVAQAVPTKPGSHRAALSVASSNYDTISNPNTREARVSGAKC